MPNRKRVIVLFSLSVALVLGFGTPVVLAQSTGNILGAVVDESGLALPGVTLTAVHLDTRQERVTVSGADGFYRFAVLPVGRYEIRTELSGFRTALRSGVTLTVAQDAVVDFTLAIGAIEETITVVADAPLVDVTSSSLGGLVDSDRLESLPLLGRNTIDLTLLQTGVTEHMNINRGTARVGTWFSSKGASLRSNNYMLDGALMQTLHGSGSGSYANNTLGLDGIEEYRVLTSGFSAEYGMRMGSQTIMVSKAGSNVYHGSAFEFFRNDALKARDFFDVEGEAEPDFSRHNAGGAVGGPLVENRTFFFGVFEGVRERLGQTLIRQTIPAEARVGAINPVVKPWVDLYPLPNLPNDEYAFVFVEPVDEYYAQGRVDHRLSDNDNVFVRYTFNDSKKTQVGTFPEFQNLGDSRMQYTTGSYTKILSPTVVNVARASLSSTRVGITPGDAISGPEFALVEGKQLGTVNPGPGISSIGYPSEILYQQKIFTVSDDLSQTVGRHSLKYGFTWNRIEPTLRVRIASLGGVTFGGLDDFLTGLPLNYNAATPGSNQDRAYVYNTYGFYLQDDFRVSNDITLNLGLRYEFNTTPNEIHGLNSAIRDVETFSELTLGPAIQNSSLKNWSPRAGFAWNVFGDGRTAIRAGTGLLYDIGWFNSNFAEGATAQPPFSGQSRVSNPGTNVTLPLFFPPETFGKVVRSNDFFSDQPKLWEYSVSVEQELPGNMGLTVAYVGSQGYDLPYTTEGNPRIPEILPDGRYFWAAGLPRRNSNWNDVLYKTTGARSWYNSLQVGVNKRMSDGLQFQSSYTWSKSESDEVVAQLNGDINFTSNVFNPNPFDAASNKGPTPWDVRHNWKFNAIYQLPETASAGAMGALLNRWSVSGIINLQTGYPFTPRINRQRSRSGVGASGNNIDRPDLVPGVNPADITSGVSRGCLGVEAGTPVGTPEMWFDPCAFTIPELGFQGTAGRDILRQPGVANVNLSIVKDTLVGLQLRLEIFNLFNRVNLGTVERTVFNARADVEAPVGSAGRITETSIPARQVQLGVRYTF